MMHAQDFQITPEIYHFTTKFNIPLEDMTSGSILLNCSMKYFGTFPNRKLAIEWDAYMVNSSNKVKFQAWLFERTNVIQFVYEKVPSNIQYFNIGLGNAYTDNSVAKPKTEYSFVSISKKNKYIDRYDSVFTLNDSISSGTSFLFVPDTLSPSLPIISLSDSFAACVFINVKDSSTNEIHFDIYKSNDTINFKLMKRIRSLDIKGIDTMYIYEERNLNSGDTLYYKVSCNNFSSVPHDTIIRVILTKPQLQGVYNIPGRFTTIAEAINEIHCRKLKGHVVLEIDINYNIKDEKFPIILDKGLETSVAKSITIRPTLANKNFDLISYDTMTFNLSTGSNIIIDGRPGGISQTGLMSLKNRFLDKYIPWSPSYNGYTVYMSNSENIAIKYCNLSCRSTTGDHSPIYGISKTKSDSLTNITISNCSFEVDSLNALYYIHFASKDTINVLNGLKIDSCEFIRSTGLNQPLTADIDISGAFNNTYIRGSHFYSDSVQD
ncbi:MAG: hypothetical protein HYZ42_05185, partial [Bacteroidetes bacterium]|nr:hypothetical protein [Bacteroidota bacterium]